MEQQSYYRIMTENGCNTQSDEMPIQVNCVGYGAHEKPFKQKNPRGREDFYLQYVTGGRLIVRTFGEDKSFTRGMFTVYRPHMPYSYELLAGEKFQYYWAHFTGFYAGRLLANLGISSDRIHQTDESARREARITAAFTRLFEEFANRRPGFDDACAAELTEILVELTRGADRVAVGPMRKLETVSYLHSHFREEFTVGELAAMEHMSLSRYRALFRQQMGLAPMEYRTALRMQYASEMLLQTENSVTEVAQSCGYDDVMYFSRLFNKKKGMSPLQYRRYARSSAEQKETDKKI